MDIYKSKRLQYIAVESHPKYDDFLHDLFNEPGMVNFTHSIPSGRRRSDTEALITSLSSSRLLLMYICLPADYVPGVIAKDPTPIGVISLTRPAEKMVQHANSAMSLLISQKYQRQGYGTEAITWALDWAFDYARLHRVELSVYDWNKDAMRLYVKLGFKDEGVKREALWFKGEWHDMHEMGILEQDWRGRAALREMMSLGNADEELRRYFKVGA
ncbi:acyl-CoA N-acyltransferase [Xylariaceae sp. FL1019]|nr:acyl-CoA N-acyltransferase [Xylariaceae sp. FL1019]